jgi:hypothetical protein
MKKIVRITQTFYVDVIMDLDTTETPEKVLNRIKEHCKNNGGEETVINQGGELSYVVLHHRRYTKKLEDKLECID